MTTAGMSSNSLMKQLNRSPLFGGLGLEVLDIFVGENLRHFRVYKKLLCAKVPYFQKMFASGFKEVIEKTVRMPEDDPDAFNQFLEWFYKGALQPVNIAKETRDGGPLFNRVKLYRFAEKHCLDVLMDLAISSIMTCHVKNKSMPNYTSIKYGYPETDTSSKLRSFMSKALARILRNQVEGGSWPATDISRLMIDNEELSLDVLRLMRGVASQDPLTLPKCTFHVYPTSQTYPYTGDVL